MMNARDACKYLGCVIIFAGSTESGAQSRPASYARIKAMLDAVPAVDTHDHLWRFDELPGLREAEDGTRVMNLASIWQNSYLSWFGVPPAWKPREPFADW